MSSYESKMMWTTKFALLAMCVVTIASTDFGARLVAQELIAHEHESPSIFERIQALPVATAAADSREFEYHGIVRTPDFSEAQAVVFCVAAEPSRKTLLGRTTTDSHGHFSLSFSASEEQSKSLQVFAIDSQDRLGWCNEFSHSKPNVLIPLLLHKNSGRIAGNLSAPHGEPVDGIPVKVWALFEPFENASGCDVDFEPFEFKTLSDANGDFAIDGLPASMPALVIINAEEFDNQQPVIATSVDTPEIKRGWVQSTSYFPGFAKIKLFPKHVLHGTVVDSQGNPIAGVHIGNQPLAGPEAVSDAEGRFTIRRLNPTALGPSVPKDYFEDIRVEPPADSRFTSTFFRLERQQFIKDTLNPIVLEGAWISGRVLSATTKQPLSGIQVGDKLHDDRPTSDSDGRFRFSLDSGPHDIQFSPNWMSGAEATQFLADPKSRAVRLIDVLDGEPVDMGNIALDIDAEAAKPVALKVVMADGSPTANCRLEFFKADSTQPGVESRRSQASLVQDKTIVEHVVTDDQGLAIIKPAMGWSEADFQQGRPLPPDARRRMRQLFSETR